MINTAMLFFSYAFKFSAMVLLGHSIYKQLHLVTSDNEFC